MLINSKIETNKSKNKKYYVYHFIRLLLAVLVMVLPTIETIQAFPLDENQSTTQLEQDSDSVFGTKGDNRWYIQGAGATTLGDPESGQFGMVGVGISHFFLNGHSINLELNNFLFEQPGDNAVGVNLATLVRSHFYRQTNWSLYIDGGAGILWTTNEVPNSGSSFNFTPQVGGGATIRIADESHLMLGVRWHHISNADLYEKNPGRDSIMGYVGLNLQW